MEVNSEDFSLIDRFTQGDQEAFAMLVKKYQDYAFNIAYSLAGTHHGAEDIAQEAFVKVYQNISSFERKSSFSTWLYRIVINSAYNYIKRQKKYTGLEYDPQPLDARKISLERLEHKDKQDIIKRSIEKLPFKYRTVLVLKDIEGLSYFDIARVLQCSIGTVESRLSRARVMLKKILEPILRKDGQI